MILAIETATDVCGAAVVHEGRVIARRSISDKNIHSEKLLTMVNDVLLEAAVPLKYVDAIAVSIGPGSFTGLRIGLSTAKGLAMAQQKPIIAVPTLDALANEYCRLVSKDSAGIVCPMIDAKRDEVYYCFYEVSAAGINRRSEYTIESITQAGERAGRYETVAFVGDGVRKMEEMPGLKVNHRYLPEIVCDPASVGIIAEHEGVKLSAEVISTLEPLYIRDFVTTRPGRKRDLPSHPLPAASQTSAHSFKG